jgi:hypothetical protein
MLPRRNGSRRMERTEGNDFMILECLLIAAVSQSTPPRESTNGKQDETRPAVLHIEPKEGSGSLVIKSPWTDDDSFTFVTCEAMIVDKQPSDLFPIKLKPEGWKREGDRCSYTWDFDKLRLEFSATPELDSVLFKYTVTNTSSETLKHVAVFPCVPSQGAPSFYPGTAEEARVGREGRKARVGKNDYSELYSRLSLFKNDKPFTFKESSIAATEKHLAFMKKGVEPFECFWFVNGEQTFDVPLIVESSRDKKYALGITMDHGVQASSNVGDGRACIHVVPRFREIGAGKSVSSTGRVYWMRGTPEAVLARYHKDFPKSVQD